MSLGVLAGFMVAGAAGAIARYLLGAFVHAKVPGRLPWGTFVVNVTGSFLLGLLTGLAQHRGFPSTPRLLLGVGFCGAYTTFSTFTFETVQLLEAGARAEAFTYAAASIGAAVLAAGAGLALAS